MLQTLKYYGIAFSVFLLIDLFWLLLIANNLYRQYLGYIMTDKPNLLAALLFYLLFVAGIVYFVIYPSIEKDSLLYALIIGGFFGLLTYATYDLTNLATIKNWPLIITVIDMIWGVFVSASVSSISFLIIKALNI